MHSFFCENIMSEGSLAELEERDHAHLFKTLRAKPGEIIGLMDGGGSMAQARILEGKRLEVIEKKVIDAPEFKLHLYIAPPRRNKMDDLLRQCTELGVWSINPLISERSVSEPDSNSIKGRWRAIAIEACKQSGNPFLPEIRETVKFEKAVDSLASTMMPVYYGCVKDGSPGLEKLKTEAALFIGPEGGFTEAEEASMAEKRFIPLRLGNWILRIETAALCVAGLLLFHGNKKN